MSVPSTPVTRSLGHALVVATPQGRSALVTLLSRFGFECAQADDPYTALVELCRRPLVYRALVLGLQGLYREELALIPTVKRRFPHLDLLLAQTDGRQSALADALRLGADGLVDADGMHRISNVATTESGAVVGTTGPRVRSRESAAPAASVVPTELPDDRDPSEPVLTAEELRALLSDPLAPTAERGEEDPQ